jgi:phage antirepressor YoqD-like protein
MHEDVAMEFARWLSPKFAIWTNDRIKELMREGVATVSDDDEVIAHAMEVLQRRLEAKQQQLQIAESTIEQQQLQLGEKQHTIDTLTPMADYTREVLQSTSTYTLTEVAKDLGLRSVSVLTDFCRKHHVLYRQSDRWLPTANYAANGFFQTRTARFFHNDGTVGTSLSTVVTEKGRVMLRKLMEQKGGVQ